MVTQNQSRNRCPTHTVKTTYEHFRGGFDGRGSQRCCGCTGFACRSGRAGPFGLGPGHGRGVAQDQGVCVRPLARRLVDRVSGEASTVVLPCGSTQESRCPTCAKRARVLRMHQCAEGWHCVDELPDADLEPGHGDGADDLESDDEADDLDADGEGSGRVVRSTRRRGDVADLPVRPMDARTVGRCFTAPDGRVYRPSMFITLTLPSYGRVVRRQGVPVDPDRYDYRRAALDAMHFAKLVDRWVQNLRRGAGFKVQYFAAIEPQRRLAPHVHV